ncbi:MAG TPA: VC0807 family protein [Caulobacteraceae bacterium]
MNVQAFNRFRPFLVDALLPIAIFYGLKAINVADLPALLAGGASPAIDALISIAIERRVRLLPVFVCGMFALTAALAFFVHDPRVMLMKEVIIFVGLGIWFLATVPFQPVIYTVAATAAARGSEERAARWNKAWNHPDFRARMRLATALFGIVFLFDAALRTVIVYRLPLSQSVILAHAPAPITLVVTLLIGRFLLVPAAQRAMSEPAS